jgi:hypothetical protein
MKDNNTDELKTKILVNIYSPLADHLTKKLNRACLKRDAYLDLVLKHECQFLRNEIAIPNTDEMKNYISKKIKELNTKPVSLYLSKETVELLNAVCDEKKVPRDAFLNRVFLLLIASEEMIGSLFPRLKQEMGNSWSFWIEAAEAGDEQWFHVRPNIVDSIEEFVTHSPFWLMRASIEKVNANIAENIDTEFEVEQHQNLYSHVFTNDSFNKLSDDYDSLKKDINLICFNTFMDDTQLVYATDAAELDLLDKLTDANKKEAREALKHRKLIQRKEFIDL